MLCKTVEQYCGVLQAGWRDPTTADTSHRRGGGLGNYRGGLVQCAVVKCAMVGCGAVCCGVVCGGEK